MLINLEIAIVQLLSRVQLFSTPWIAAKFIQVVGIIHFCYSCTVFFSTYILE